MEGLDDSEVLVFLGFLFTTTIGIALYLRSTTTTQQLHPAAVIDIHTFQQQQLSNPIPPPPHFMRQSSAQICPICLDSPPTHEILTNCGHAFCGECIVEFWKHSGSPRGTLPCPCCRTPLTILHAASPHSFQGGQAIQNEVQHFNRTCSSRPRSWREQFHDAPVLFRILCANPFMFFRTVRILVHLVHFMAIAGAALLYVVSPFDLLPEIMFGPVGLIDDGVVGLIAFVALAEVVRRVVVAAVVPAVPAVPVPAVPAVVPPTVVAGGAAAARNNQVRQRSNSRQRVS